MTKTHVACKQLVLCHIRARCCGSKTYRETEPADEAMVPLKRIVVVVPHPGERAENRDEDERRGEHTGGDDGAVLHGLQPDDVDHLVDKPANGVSVNIVQHVNRRVLRCP